MGKKSKDKKQYYKVGTYCTEDDLNCLQLAIAAEACGLITNDDISVDSETGEVKVNYSDKALRTILEKIFGFRDGWYETEILPIQTTRFGGRVIENKKRYMGWERQDRDWVDSKSCSDEMRTAVIFGKTDEV